VSEKKTRAGLAPPHRHFCFGLGFFCGDIICPTAFSAAVLHSLAVLHPHPSPVTSTGRWSAAAYNVLGPVPGVDVMAKRSQGWVKCEDRLPYYKDSSCSLPNLPRLHDPRPRFHDSRGPRRGRGRPGSRARSSGALAAMQRKGAVPDSFVQNKMTCASHL
jgi:hypothetical protein